MKKVITIKRLTLINFKGQKSLNIDFENETDILGANGTGKTTIADGVNWLWFGKDSQDRKDFKVQPLDLNNKMIPMIDVEVSAVYDIDGDEVTMRRVLRQNWVKKRGEANSEYSGNVTDLYWNDVPMNVGDFNKKVDAVCTEVIFKTITSPSFFTNLDWKQQRSLLIQMVGDVSDQEIAQGNPAYEALIANLTQGKTMDDYNAQIKASVKKAKDDLALIPTRIDEVSRTKPEAQDFKALETELAGFQKDLDKVDAELDYGNLVFNSKLNDQKELKININNVEVEIRNIETNALSEARQRLTPDTSALNRLTNSLSTKQGELNSLKSANATLEQKQTNINATITETIGKMDAKRSEWQTENAKELSFGDNDFHCPTCKRDFEAGDVEAKKDELINTFKLEKNTKLISISAEGQRLKTYKETLEKELEPIPGQIESNNNSITQLGTEIEKIKAEINSINNVDNSELPSELSVYESILSSNTTYGAKVKELETLKAQLVEIPTIDNSELTEKRKKLVDEIDNIKGRLNLKTQIDSVDKRIEELKEQGKALAQQIVDVEKIQFTIENFIKDKIDRFESAINEKFKMVKFKMFETQINQGIKETCIATVNGVPFSDLNTASRINAGLDIISTLSDFYGVSAPIFVDNAESVHTIIPTESQLIRLVVSEMHKQLEVKTKELAA